MTMPTRLRWRQFTKVYGVYVIGIGQFIKIGWSSSIGRRMSQIEEGLPEELLLYRILLSREMADEQHLHRRFARYRRKGEWFAYEGALRDFSGESPLMAHTVPDTRADALALLTRTDDISQIFCQPHGPPTIRQRATELAAMGGGVLFEVGG